MAQRGWRFYSRLRSFQQLCPTERLFRSCIKVTMSNGTHLERTSDSHREKILSLAVVTDIYRLSSTVKGFTLRVANRQLEFLAGQWVDLHIAGEEVVGGYSITSPPHQLSDPKSCSIDLAIKHSIHPPTLWMTNKCVVGDEVNIRVGGDFCYSPSPHQELPDLILIAGGVGINPLLSMVLHHIKLAADHSMPVGKGSVHLLHSSRTEDELLFKDKLRQICSDHARVNTRYFVTAGPVSAAAKTTKRGHICATDVEAVLNEVGDRKTVRSFVCGPPPMTEAMIDILTKHCNIAPSQIHFERWW